MAGRSTMTLGQPGWADESYLVASMDSGSEAGRSVSYSETTLFQRALGKFEMMLLPLTIAASFGGPAVGSEYCRSIVRSKASHSIVDLADWNEDVWIYTEEIAAIAEIHALNELLALPTREGAWVELDEG